MTRPASWKYFGLIIGIIAVGVGLDQAAKALALSRLTPGEPIRLVSDIFSLDLFFNSGAAFSSAANLTVALAVLALVVLVGVFIWVVPKVRSRSWAVAVGLGLGGVAGNFVDRLVRPPGPFRGSVVDFFALKYFAVFNIADMMLTAAAIMIVILALILRVDITGKTDRAHRVRS